MRKIATLVLIVLAVSLAMPGPAASGPGDAGQLVLKPQATLATVAPPKTSASKMDRSGPVRSPDPYYTIKVGEAEIYRDAKDPSLAYYKPVIRLARRVGTPLAEGVGLAGRVARRVPLPILQVRVRRKSEMGQRPDRRGPREAAGRDPRSRSGQMEGHYAPRGPASEARRFDGDPDDASLSAPGRRLLGIRSFGSRGR
ncbi:MAG: hypothetical protein MZU91_10950 [Desulfosudis oleivorans]|nr:hypothetical protein [Desulfosudis oleivorans]